MLLLSPHTASPIVRLTIVWMFLSRCATGENAKDAYAVTIASVKWVSFAVHCFDLIRQWRCRMAALTHTHTAFDIQNCGWINLIVNMYTFGLACVGVWVCDVCMLFLRSRTVANIHLFPTSELQATACGERYIIANLCHRATPSRCNSLHWKTMSIICMCAVHGKMHLIVHRLTCWASWCSERSTSAATAITHPRRLLFPICSKLMHVLHIQMNRWISHS